jgi:oligoribonuclease
VGVKESLQISVSMRAGEFAPALYARMDRAVDKASRILRQFNSSPIAMPQDANHLIWIDMEMTGLNPDADRIIEVALVVTDGNLDVVAEAPVWVVHQDDAVLDGMDSWNKGTHGKSGLIDKVKASALTDGNVQESALAFLCEHVPSKASPMCATSTCRR